MTTPFQPVDLTTRMRRRGRGLARAVVVGGAGLGLVLAGTAAASGQSGGSGTGSGDPGSLLMAPAAAIAGLPSASVTGSAYLGGSVPIASVLGSLDAVGSGEFARPGSSAPPSEPVATRDLSITGSEVLSKKPMFPGHLDPEFARAEEWTVTSAAMQREIRVEVYRAPARYSSAPIVYFLDGVGSESPSGWSGGMGFGSDNLRSKPVTVVAPTGAPASMWSDWEEDDKVLGPNKWETFLTDELPGLLKAGGGGADPVPFDDEVVDFGTLGISMGGGPALHLANRHPGMFRGAASVSGCFSTTDELGYQYTRLTAESRGGTLENLWGPRGSAEWTRHDTVNDPSGLAGQRVYMSAATGLIGSVDMLNFGPNPAVMADGHLLEKGAYECTRALEASLADAGIEHRVDYDPTGIHNWPVFIPRVTNAMEYILPGLGAPTVSSRAAAPGTDTPGGGSLGSTGSLGSSGSASTR